MAARKNKIGGADDFGASNDRVSDLLRGFIRSFLRAGTPLGTGMWMIIGCNFFAPLGGRKGLGGHPSGAPAVRMASIMRSRCARNTGLSLSPKARTLPIDEILLFGIAAEVGERQHHEGETRGLAALGRRRRRVRKSRLGDVE